MLNQKSHLTLAVVLVAATLLIAGSVAIASNTGFKINKPLYLTVGGAPLKGNNWSSLPYFHPYPNGQALCQQLGLRSNPPNTNATSATLLKINPVDGSAPLAICGTAAASFTWSAGQGVRIRNTAGTGAPTSAIIVGSHNPAVSLTIPPAGIANIGSFWFAVPYHTTAVNGQDLCNAVGLVSTGALATRGALLRANADLGSSTPGICGSSAAPIILTLGEAIRLRQPGAGVPSFVPAHF